MSFYLALISFAPCDDVHSSGEPTAISTGHGEHEQEADGCSPFCICSCCHGFVLISSIFKNISFIIGKDMTFSNYLLCIPNPDGADVWQPPQ